MINYLINRPISVIMAFLGFFILGIITYLNIPVSLLPDIAIPEITVQIPGQNISARELENTIVSPIRQQLLQVGNLQDIRTETRDGNAIIQLSFDYGVDTDLAFIEVNEKIDAAMNHIPKEMPRPRVIKASATDIPVLNLNLTLKSDVAFQQTGYDNYLNLSEFSETVIKRRIEQLPQVAMVDISGLMNKQVIITPDNNFLEISGLSLSDIEQALNNNNIEPGSMIIRDGYYEYNVKFTSVLRTVDDIRNIYIRKNDRIYQLRELAKVEIAPEKEKGMAVYNGKRAVVLSVIKQSEENMADMQESMENIINHFRNEYPDIEFNISQNQTELLDYSISNLEQNLILAFIFVCMISVIFLRDVRSPLIIGISMFISLIISLLFFYLFHISLNVISLTGLILALGMMIDNSIIVTDNIGQYRSKNMPLNEACIKGTNEVIAPMLSSVFTTISVFVPLIFLSGIAGAIFFDQAFSVTVGLLVSFATGIILLPVLYKIAYSTKFKSVKSLIPAKKEREKLSLAQRAYDTGIHWIFAHKGLTIISMIAVFPICFYLFMIIPKTKMPDIHQTELLVGIEWNENIHVEENLERIVNLLKTIDTEVIEESALIGQQQFLLNKEKDFTGVESEVYLKVKDFDKIPSLKKTIQDYFQRHYPDVDISFKPAGTVYEKIFSTGGPDLTVEYYARNKTTIPEPEDVLQLERRLGQQTGEKPASISFHEQLNLSIDKERLLLYKISYDEIYHALKTAFKENKFSTLRSYQQYLPIVLGSNEKTVNDILDNTMVNAPANEDGTPNKLSLRTFVSIMPGKDLKTIVAGRSGEYIPIHFYDCGNPEKVIKTARKDVSENENWDIDFSGNFFYNNKMMIEFIVILLVSILLMYFILAAQFESFTQPLIVLLEIPIDIAASLGLLLLLGYTLNLMSAIGIVVTCGIIINDSILKVDVMNQLRKSGMPLMEALHVAGIRRLNAILMTSLTAIACMVPLLFSNDLGANLEKPLAIAMIGGMVIGTPVSLFVVPLVYWWIYKNNG